MLQGIETPLFPFDSKSISFTPSLAQLERSSVTISQSILSNFAKVGKILT